MVCVVDFGNGTYKNAINYEPATEEMAGLV